MDKSTNLNILDWWKVNSTKYPIILRMTRNILTILVLSTVASESAFRVQKEEYLTSIRVV